MSDDDDAAHRLAFAVPLGDAPSHFGTHADPRHVFQENRRAVRIDPSEILRMSSTDPMVPRPRIMNSFSANSRERPPTSLLLAATASRIFEMECRRRAAGSDPR